MSDDPKKPQDCPRQGWPWYDEPMHGSQGGIPLPDAFIRERYEQAAKKAGQYTVKGRDWRTEVPPLVDPAKRGSTDAAIWLAWLVALVLLPWLFGAIAYYALT
jgi:hypothetical protein